FLGVQGDLDVLADVYDAAVTDITGARSALTLIKVQNLDTDLALTMTGSADFSPPPGAGDGIVRLGHHLTYTLDVENQGATATGVVLTDTLPAGVTFVSASGGGTLAGNTVTFDLGTMIADASRTVTIEVIPTAPGTYTNTAQVTSQTFDEYSP